jgi:hypothetical protein
MLIANQGAAVQVGDEVFTIRAGQTRVRADSPLVKAAPHVWEPLETQYDIEQATRAPGEKRRRSRSQAPASVTAPRSEPVPKPGDEG